MDYVGLVESLDVIEIFLGWSFATVRHSKEIVSKAVEKTKAMTLQLKAMKAEAGKSKQLGLELTKSRGTVKKLQEDLDKHVAYLSSKAKENNALSNRVVDLEQQVKDIG